MRLQPVPFYAQMYPEELLPILSGAKLYDSSSSPEARVIFIHKDNGYFLKSAPKGTLQREAELTAWFHTKGLSANVLAYISKEMDWLLTEKVQGDDCTAEKYLAQPKRLCDVLSERLWILHHTDFADCPVQNHTEMYLERACSNYHRGVFDGTLFPDNWRYTSAKEAYSVLCSHGHVLTADTLLHGDYCLPNIILQDWKLSGFVDVGCGGVGDRHVDLFWALWTLEYNLKTDKYRQRFIDGYGRQYIEEDLLRVVAAVEVFS